MDPSNGRSNPIIISGNISTCHWMMSVSGQKRSGLPADLYLLAENMIRKEVEGLRVVPAEESLQNLQKYLPDETFLKIQEISEPRS
ncbi:MAG: hypothetical protein V9E84_09950 [Trichococcus flocculiformis]